MKPLTNRFGQVERVYPKTYSTEFMKIKGIQLAGLVTTLRLDVSGKTLLGLWIKICHGHMDDS